MIKRGYKMITTKAALLYGSKDIRIEETSLGDLLTHQVLIKVHTTSLCPTDLRKYLGYVPIPGPLILGHEITGTIEKIGTEISSLAAGDQVTVYSIIPCNYCRYCRLGMPELCKNLVGIGGSAGSLTRYYKTFLSDGIGGGLSEYLKVPERIVVKLAPGISLKQGSIIEPLANVVRGQNMCNPGPGKIELIFGGGPIGLMHLLVAKKSSLNEILVVEPIKERRKMAEEFGASRVINPEEEDVTTEVLEYTDGDGPDITIVATGWSSEAKCTELAVKLAAKGGLINIFASTHPKRMINIDPNDIHYKELNLLGSFDHRPWNYYEAMDLLIYDKDKFNKIIYPSFPLTDIKKAFESYGKEGSMKVAVQASS